MFTLNTGMEIFRGFPISLEDTEILCVTYLRTSSFLINLKLHNSIICIHQLSGTRGLGDNYLLLLRLSYLAVQYSKIYEYVCTLKTMRIVLVFHYIIVRRRVRRIVFFVLPCQPNLVTRLNDYAKQA